MILWKSKTIGTENTFRNHIRSFQELGGQDRGRGRQGGPGDFFKAVENSMSLFCGGFQKLVELYNKKGEIS